MANSFLMGVNLAWGGVRPPACSGSLGTDYTYPTHTEIDYYASKGLDVIRLPFLPLKRRAHPKGTIICSELHAYRNTL